ncbi:hypothetical protein GCM10010211_71690 [Streptomyces albospinus]|uniref:Secreted protein n=1 Tax=Streptomyces albospinus TaxID=285515 RepID=A0ABQ2VLJ9_9ACTN|nr:hypothetical protein GCM10010211_71690 [Streptomyces albospinus]
MRRIAKVAVSAAALLALGAPAANADSGPDAPRNFGTDPGRSLTDGLNNLFGGETSGEEVDQAVG